MVDHIASFALRGTAHEELGRALGRCYAEFSAWLGQATLVANFAQDARIGGVKNVLADRIHQMLNFGEAEGLIINTPEKTKSNREIAYDLADHQLVIADQGVKTSAIVMLHNACERFLWRLVRFGLVKNRDKAFELIGKRKIAVEALKTQDVDTLIDEQIERWWTKLERSTLKDKWDQLVNMVGYPKNLSSPPVWHFDREMLVDFDGVRHNAVHHDAQAVKAFGFDEFAKQLGRSQFVCLVQIASLLNLKIPAETLFTGK